MRSLWLCVWNKLRQGTRVGMGGDSVHVGGLGRSISDSCWGSIEGQGTGGGLVACPIVTR